MVWELLEAAEEEKLEMEQEGWKVEEVQGRQSCD